MQLFFMMLAYSKARVFTSEDLQTPCMALGALFRMYGEQCSENDSRRSGYITDGHGTNAVAYSVVNQGTTNIKGKDALFAWLADQHRSFETRAGLICAKSSQHSIAHAAMYTVCHAPQGEKEIVLCVCGLCDRTTVNSASYFDNDDKTKVSLFSGVYALMLKPWNGPIPVDWGVPAVPPWYTPLIESFTTATPVLTQLWRVRNEAKKSPRLLRLLLGRRDRNGQSFLQRAIRARDYSVTELLLQWGANATEVFTNGETPLTLAAQQHAKIGNDHTKDLVQLLLDWT